MTRALSATIAAAVALLLPMPGTAAPAAPGKTAGELTTFYELLIGKPRTENGQEPSLDVVPGTVVLAEPEYTSFSRDVGVLGEKLAETYRLGPVLAVAAARLDLATGVRRDLPTPFDELGVGLTLIGWNADVATYQVRLESHGALLAAPTVAVRVGGRAVVATRDGDRAPYAFVVLAPRSPMPEPVKAGSSEPRVVEKVAPVYPAAARKAHVQGVVLLDCTVGTDGRVKRIDVLKAQPDGLTEAAVEAVSRWRYEPVRDEQGRPVEETIVVTITFRLE